MNPVTMTIINPEKNIGRAGDRTCKRPILKSATLPTDKSLDVTKLKVIATQQMKGYYIDDFFLW